MRKFIAAASTLVATAVFLIAPATASQAGAPTTAARCGGCTIGF